MRGILRTIRRVGSDILSGKNLEAYVIAAMALVLAIFGIIDDALSDNIKLAAILAALSLLVFKTTTPDKQPTDLDSILLDRQSFGAFRDFIRGGRALWIYAPSGVNVLRSAAEIKQELLDKGGRLRVLVQDPEGTDGLGILHRQLDKLFSLDLDDDIKASLRTLRNMRTWNTPGKVEYGLLPYSPGFSLVIVDPDGRDGRLIIEFFGYQTELISERMHIQITRQQSQYWFEYWAKQFDNMWKTARFPESLGTDQQPASAP
jgi:hypothetical protein